MSYDMPPPATGTIQALPFAVVGPLGSSFPAASYGNDINAALTAASKEGFTHLYIAKGTWSYASEWNPTSTVGLVQGEGRSITILKAASGYNGRCWSGNAAVDWLDWLISDLSVDCTNLNAPATSAPSISSASNYTVLTTGYLFITLNSATISAATLNGGQWLASASAVQKQLVDGAFVLAGDVLNITYAGGSPTFSLYASNEPFNFTTPNYRVGTETRNPVSMRRVEVLNATNVSTPLCGGVGSSGIWDGCENSNLSELRFQTHAGIMARTYNGSVHVSFSDIYQLIEGGVLSAPQHCAIGGGGFIHPDSGQNAICEVSFFQCYFNGANSTYADLTLNASVPVNLRIDGGYISGGVAGVSATNYANGSGLANYKVVFGLTLVTAGSLASGTAFFSGAPAYVGGTFTIPTSGTGTVNQIMTNATTGFATILRGAVTTNWYNGQSYTVYGGTPAANAFGAPVPVTITVQKAETNAADANVATFVPIANAVGVLRVSYEADVASATNGVISFTLTWKDSNGNTVTNQALPLFQLGTAAPNTTFTTSAASRYSGSIIISIANEASPTHVVLKWVGGGTTVATVSAYIEQLG